jgi:UDP-glucose 6-dehydrogenase
VVEVNWEQAEHFVSIARDEIGELDGKTVAVLGLSFKADASDIRESPAFKIIDGLLKYNAKVTFISLIRYNSATVTYSKDRKVSLSNFKPLKKFSLPLSVNS